MSVTSILFALVLAGFGVVFLLDPRGTRSVFKRVDRLSDRDAERLFHRLGERLERHGRFARR
jgi:hypothetical protein